MLPHHHGGADTDAGIEIGHVFVGHAEAARRHRLSDGLRLIGTVDAVERRAEIDGARAEWVVDAAGHMARQIRASPAHFLRRGPARPFLLRGHVVHAAPPETVAADADAILQRRPAALHKIEPPLGGVHHDRARRIVRWIADRLTRARPAATTIVAASIISAALVAA